MQYTCEGYYADGSIDTLQSLFWSVSCDQLEIDENGKLSIPDTASSFSCDIIVKYNDLYDTLHIELFTGIGDVGLNELKVYPNPFTKSANFEFSRDKGCVVSLELFDIVGRKVAVLFEQYIEANQSYRVEFVPDNIATNMIIYRMTFDDEVINGRLIYKE